MSNVRNADLAGRKTILNSTFVSVRHYMAAITIRGKFKTAPRGLIGGFILQRNRQSFEAEFESSIVLSEE